MYKQHYYFIIHIIAVLSSIIPFVLTFKCRLYELDQSSIETKLIEINNSSSYNLVLNLGHSTFSSKATSTKIGNQNYVSTYHTFDSLGVPHYFLLIVDIYLKSIKLNLTLNEKYGSGSFWQVAAISDDDIIGIRESLHPGSTLVMTYASKRRLYYNVIESTLYAINVDTGNIDVNIQIPNDYLIYALDYDSINDRLIALVYSSSITNGWILTQMIITAKQEITFDRIGKIIIPFEKYLWATIYTISSNKNSWMTIWRVEDSNASIFISFNIDNGEIIEKWEIRSRDLGNLVCFD
ncbi:unnamed protein product [Rotaria sp. Silwood2]|nr:unnamed protein product [Rotaria sp. Silwood2]CAF2866869.1 unnamed protein product [Rotaria sp. Silwood2]CAF3193225.1 unnamed protein product [Rotaria sp. Silwood2]CAF3324089.1 unnamed protein product [Rotaria sp. Silwood2]CAF4000787.1 unnamed protein product [Rotaria sp. Silwood2]